jgi:hypothetical protein
MTKEVPINTLLITNALNAPVNTGFLLEWGSRGREFKSLHPDHKKP